MTEPALAHRVLALTPITGIRDAELGARLATSATCDVYALDDVRVVKLYAARARIDDIRRETRIATLVHQAGLPAPWVDERLLRSVDSGRYGVVYGRVHGTAVSRMPMRHTFRLHALARRFAAEHLRLHAHPPPPGLPALRERMAAKIDRLATITADQRRRLHALLSSRADGRVVCHGDFHHSNLMFRDDGSAVVIDWGDGAVGPAACDVARSWVLARFGDRDGNPVRRCSHRLFGRAYLRAYLAASPIDRRELAGWILLNVAQRLSETTVPIERRWLSGHLERHL